MSAAKKSDDELLRGFLKDCRVRGMTEESVRRYGSSLGIFIDFLKNKGACLLDVNREVLREFIYHLREFRKNSQKTIENDFSALSSFYDYLAYEKITDSNPVLAVRKRYLRRYKESSATESGERQCPSIERMASFIESIPNSRDRALALLLAKTGMWRGELIRIDVNDLDWEDQSILLKPTPKRSNRRVYFDDECLRELRRWIEVRNRINPGTMALFVNKRGKRLKRQGVYSTITKWARVAGLHDSRSKKLEARFSPHCFRHWFTTHLLRSGMPREYVKELRGDIRNEAVDIYNHIDREDLKRRYLACIPVLGV